MLTPIVVPTPPAEVPGYAQLDESSGLHVTGKVQVVDLPSYRLKVTGKVDRPLELTYDDLRCMPKKLVPCTLVCPGFFEDTGTWSGASLKQVLRSGWHSARCHDAQASQRGRIFHHRARQRSAGG